MEKKITLKEFWESKVSMGIHCDTEEKANILLKAFDKIGNKWVDGDSYLSHNCWKTFKENTIYFNDKCYGDVEYAEFFKSIVYEFEEVDLSGYIYNVEDFPVLSGIPFFKNSIKIPLSKLAFLRLDIEGIYPNKEKKLVVVKFDENTTIKVQCQKEDEFDLYIGVALAINYKLFESKTQFRKFVDKNTIWQVSKEKKVKPKEVEKATQKLKKKKKNN